MLGYESFTNGKRHMGIPQREQGLSAKGELRTAYAHYIRKLFGAHLERDLRQMERDGAAVLGQIHEHEEQL